MSYEPQFVKLRIYNLTMGCLHLAQAVIIFLISNEILSLIYPSGQ